MNYQGGTVFSHIDAVLKNHSFYNDFRINAVCSETYASKLLASKQALVDQGVAEADVHFSARFPRNEQAFVAQILSDLKQNNILPNDRYSSEAFAEYEKIIKQQYIHDSYATYIYPEEEQLLYALCAIAKPKRVAFLGAYYGYWAAWALPHIQDNGGSAYLLDVDQDVVDLAARNIRKLGFEGCARAIKQDAIEFMQNTDDQFDMLVIDAECDQSHPDPDFRGKAIYHPLLQAALPKLKQGGLVVCHNILLKNTTNDVYMDGVIQKNMREHRKFVPLVQTSLRKFIEYTSTEGVGIGMK